MKVNTNVLFYLGYILFLISNMFSEIIIIEKFLPYINYLAIIVLFIYSVIVLFFSKNNKETIAKLVLCTTLFLTVTLVSNNITIIKLLILILAFKNIDFDDFIKKDFKFRLIFLIIVIILSLFGFTSSLNRYRFDGAIRYSLGFPHPNTLGLHTLVLSISYLYIHRNDQNKIKIIIPISALLFNIFITDSRSCIVALVLIIIYTIIPHSKIEKLYNNKIIKVIFKNMFLIIFMFSLIITFNYKTQANNWINKLDTIFSNRILLSNYYIQRFNPLSLFGNELYKKNINGVINKDYYALDNGYIHMLLEQGVLYSGLIIILYYLIIKKSYKQKNYTLITIMILWSFYALMENNAFMVPYNAFALAFALPFYNNK